MENCQTKTKTNKPTLTKYIYFLYDLFCDTLSICHKNINIYFYAPHLVYIYIYIQICLIFEVCIL